MKIILINNRYGRNAVGGAEHVVSEQAEAFRNAGNAVQIIASESFHGWRSLTVHSDAEDEQEVLRFFVLNIASFERIPRLPFIARVVWHPLNIFNVHSALAIARWLLEHRPDRIVTHNLMGIGFLTRFAIGLSRISNIEYRVSRWSHYLHDIQLLHPSGVLLWGQERSGSYRGLSARCYRACTRWLMGSPDEVVSPSRWLLEEHRKFGFFGKSKQTIVRHSGLTRIRSTLDSGLAMQARQNDNVIHLLFIGQIEPHKGIEFFLQAISSIEYRISNIYLHIVGDGSQYQQLRVQYPQHQWHGRLERSALDSIWQHTDALIVPSLCYENAPTVIVEALRREIPVVASRLGGIPELLEEGISGWLFTPGNARDLVGALERMVKSKYPNRSIAG